MLGPRKSLIRPSHGSLQEAYPTHGSTGRQGDSDGQTSVQLRTRWSHHRTTGSPSHPLSGEGFAGCFLRTFYVFWRWNLLRQQRGKSWPLKEHRAFFFSSSVETNKLKLVFYFLFQTLSTGWRSLFCAVQSRRGARSEGSAQSLRENVEPCRKQEAGRSWWIARAPPAQRSPWIEAAPVPIHTLPWIKTEAFRRPGQTSRSAASSWPRERFFHRVQWER